MNVLEIYEILQYFMEYSRNLWTTSLFNGIFKNFMECSRIQDLKMSKKSVILFNESSCNFSRSNCTEGAFIRCSWCNLILCFQHFFIDYHYHSGN